MCLIQLDGLSVLFFENGQNRWKRPEHGAKSAVSARPPTDNKERPDDCNYQSVTGWKMRVKDL